MRSSAARSIGTMIEMGNQGTINIVVSGVSAIVQSTNVGHQQASAILLSTLCEYPDKDYAFNFVSNFFDQILAILNGTEPVVLSNTLSGLCTIAETFPNLFWNHRYIADIIDKLFQLLQLNNSNASNSVFQLFRNITENIEENNILISD